MGARRGRRRRLPSGWQPTLGVPTWFYGHESSNFFATHVAQYFAKAIRGAMVLVGQEEAPAVLDA